MENLLFQDKISILSANDTKISQRTHIWAEI